MESLWEECPRILEDSKHLPCLLFTLVFNILHYYPVPVPAWGMAASVLWPPINGVVILLYVPLLYLSRTQCPWTACFSFAFTPPLISVTCIIDKIDMYASTNAHVRIDEIDVCIFNLTKLLWVQCILSHVLNECFSCTYVWCILVRYLVYRSTINHSTSWIKSYIYSGISLSGLSFRTQYKRPRYKGHFSN